jgi:multicomponent Na+:H+ antiporter subunit D
MMVLPVILPLLGALLAFVCGRGAARWIGIAVALATLAAVVALSAEIRTQGVRHYELGGWKAPLGIALYADGLSAIMLLGTAAVGALVTVYSAVYFRRSPAERFFWPLWLFLWGGLNGLYLSGDIFNLYVVLETVTLSAVALAALGGGRTALTAALRYLLAAVVASLAYLMGVGLLYGNYGVLDLAMLAGAVRSDLPTVAAFGLMMLALLLKSALFPMHFWLPPAHSAAAAPVSALLSALVVKGGFYLALRLWFGVFPAVATFEAGQMLGGLGAAAILWGSFQALRQKRLKLLLAHSTVGQVGYLFLIFPLATVPHGADGAAAPWISEAWTGCIYHALSHAFAKAAIFLAAGVILAAAGNDRIGSMRDIAGRLPATTFALALAGVSLIGLPPSGGFVAKWMILQGVIASGQWWWAPVIVAGSLLTAGYVFLMIRYTFKPAAGELVLKPVSRTMQTVPLVLALLAVLIGFVVEEPLRLLETGDLFRLEKTEGAVP